MRHSKDDALSPEEVSALLYEAKGIEKFLISALIFGGLRVSELSHMQKDWIHIGDKEAERNGVDHIQIPVHGIKCKCNDCMLQAFFELDRGKEKKTAEWYKEKRKEFHELKRSGMLPKLDSVWSPKSSAGARLIPIHFEKFRNELKFYFKSNTRVTKNRHEIWRIVKRVGKRTFGKDKVVYPHCIRATCSSIWADSDLSLTDLTVMMGWKSQQSAVPYLRRNVKKMIRNTKKKESVWEGII